MDSALPLVSVVCVATPDKDILPNFHSSLFRVLRPLESAYRFEVLYVGTRTSGDSLAQMETLAQLDPRVGLLSSEAVDFDAAQRFGLQRAAGAMVVFLDPSTHPADVLPRLLEKAGTGCPIVNGVSETLPRSPSSSWRLGFSGAQRLPACLLLQREAADLVMASTERERSMAETALATSLPRGELTFAPVPFRDRDATMNLRRLLQERFAAYSHDPLSLVTAFGGTVFLIGVFLALWFPLQSKFAPGTVWFSWCYLIVLLHILGGSILYALGRVIALARQILERVPEPQQVDAKGSQDSGISGRDLRAAA